MATKRDAQKAETRLRLKQAAHETFTDMGIEGATIGAITRRAGTAHGTFYVHFADKDELVEELVHDLNEGLVALIAPLWLDAEAEDPQVLVRRSAEAFCDHWLAHRDFVLAAAHHLISHMPLASARDGFNAGLLAFLAPHLQRRLDGPAPKLVAPALLALWARVGLQLLSSPGVTRRDAVETLVFLTTGALRLVPPDLAGTRPAS